MKNYKEAVECLEDVRLFLEPRGHTEAATETDMLVNKVTQFQCSQMSFSVQSSITSYVVPVVMTTVEPLTLGHANVSIIEVSTLQGFGNIFQINFAFA